MVDVRDLVTRYFTHVTDFYEWFAHRQREVHGIGPDVYRHLLTHGAHVGPRSEVSELAAGIDRLREKAKGTITFTDLEQAFHPVLSIVDSRRLMLCKYDGRVWIHAALEAAKSRFIISAEIESRSQALVGGADASSSGGEA